MELTAARQSGILTPFPLLIAYSEPFDCKDSANSIQFKIKMKFFILIVVLIAEDAAS